MIRINAGPRRRVRRGGTIVFVAVFAVVLVALAAFAIDVSRLYVGTNELQTGADASALRGARFLQLNRGQDPTSAVQAFDQNNQALEQPVDVASANVKPVFWDPTATPKATYLNSWSGANAVEVTSERSTGLLFGRLLTSVTQTPRRKAIAWVANITRVVCPAPWGFPLPALNQVVFGTPDYSVRSDYYAALDAKLNSTGPLSLAIILYPPDLTSQTGANQSWPFEAIDDDNVNMNQYPNQLANNGNCASDAATGVNEVETFPGVGGGTIPQKTVRGTMGHQSINGSLCEPNPPGSTVDCYPVGSSHQGSAGVSVTVSWIGPVTANSATVQTIGGFRVMCVYGSPNGNGNGNGNPGGAQTCAYYDQYRNSAYAPAGLPATLQQGTIVGYPVNVAPGLGNGTSLGNAPTLAQRLILVR